MTIACLIKFLIKLQKSVTFRLNFHYNAENDIMWMRGDLLRKTTSAGVFPGILHNACYDQFANIAIDVETLFSNNFLQGQAIVLAADQFRPTDDIRTLPFFETFAPKKWYLIYSRSDQKGLATETSDLLLAHMKRNEKGRKERFDSIMKLKGIEGCLWTWPVVEAILESDLSEDKKGWRNNIIVR
ncbi:uncharacterized protein EAF01_009746 [Botrytis porri]|uniref:uncharacterized protein n=1 Tax=Botrytis porri TaxID=87229 RepID=UPI0019017AD1|nr:uncharacterized protein EAF01_009746 [Botrytis porri]KAF7895784.1 hypothetical protein EAF01_009746 [Botrytis porri]